MVSSLKMASSTKKKHVEISEVNDEEQIVDRSEDEDSDEDNSDGESVDEEINEEIQVDFEAFPPQQGDFHGIKKLLQQLFLKSNVDISGATDIILSQNHIGCVLKDYCMKDYNVLILMSSGVPNVDNSPVENFPRTIFPHPPTQQSEAQIAEESDSDDEIDDNIYGIASVISLTDKQDIPCVKQIRGLLLTKCDQCADTSLLSEFKKLLTSGQNKVGLLLSERFYNIPPQLAPPLHQSLQDDLSKARMKNDKYNFDFFVLLCKSYEMLEARKKKKKRKESKLYEEERNVFFSNAEDEIFQKEAILQFKYSITEETDTAIGGSWSSDEAQLNTFRTVLVVPASRMDHIVKEIERNLNQ